MVSLLRPLVAGACAVLNVAPLAEAGSPRKHLSLDERWKFHPGDGWPDALSFMNSGTGSGPASGRFADFCWRVLNLPHDWAIELPDVKLSDLICPLRISGSNLKPVSLSAAP